jgi:hypothetical protein
MYPSFRRFLLLSGAMVALAATGCSHDTPGVFDPPTAAVKRPSLGVLRGTIELDAEALDAATGGSIFVYHTLDDFRNHVADLLRATELLPRDDPRPEYFVVEVPVVRRHGRLVFQVALEPGEYLLAFWKDTQPDGMIDAADPFFFVCTDDCPTPAVVKVEGGQVTRIRYGSEPGVDLSGSSRATGRRLSSST